MKDKLLIILLIALVVSIHYNLKDYMPEGVTYDCRLAEISPDFPPKVKEECRKLRMEQRKTKSVTT